MKNSLRESVWKTVCWFDVFSYPANAEEIHRFLIGEKAQLNQVKACLEKDRRIGKSFGFYFPKGKQALVLQRCGKQFHAKKLWRRVIKHLFIFKLTPFLKFVGVGNTLAMGFPKKESDIDLLVVTKEKRLFTSRFFLTFFTQIFGMRRSGKKIKGRFCLSFFLEEGNLNLEKIKITKEDIYLAFWVATLTPIFGDGGEFFANNVWVKQTFPNLKLPTTQKSFRKKNLLEKLLDGRLGNLVERRLKNWQLKRAKSKQKNTSQNAVIIEEKMLKFHESDKRKEFLEAWRKKI